MRLICPFCKESVTEGYSDNCLSWSHRSNKDSCIWHNHFKDIDDALVTARDILDDTVECVMAFEADADPNIITADDKSIPPIEINIIVRGKV